MCRSLQDLPVVLMDLEVTLDHLDLC